MTDTATHAGPRRPYRGSHLVTRLVGPVSIIAVSVAFAAAWVVARPDGPTGTFVGQLLGAEGVLLLSVALVLISTLGWVEQFFDGVDKAAVWHRRVAIAGTALIGVHIATTSNPDATELLREGGMPALEQSTISVPAFVPLAFTSFVVLLGLAVVLVAFLRSGHAWARWALLALVVLAVFSTGVAVTRGLPTVFVVLAVVTIGVELALVRYLFHRDTGRYLRVG